MVALPDYTRNEEEKMILEISRLIFEEEQAGREKDNRIAALEYQIEMLEDQRSFGDMQKELEMIKTQMQELSNLASVPVSRIEVLETIVSHQGTQLESFEQEHENLRTELKEVREHFLKLSRSSRTPTTFSDSSFSTAGHLSYVGNSMKLYGNDENCSSSDLRLESHTARHSLCSVSESTRLLALHSENLHNQGSLCSLSVQNRRPYRRGQIVRKRSAIDVVDKLDALFL